MLHLNSDTEEILKNSKFKKEDPLIMEIAMSQEVEHGHL